MPGAGSTGCGKRGWAALQSGTAPEGLPGLGDTAGAWGQRHGVLLGLGTLPGLGDNATGHCWGLGTLPGLGDNAMGHCRGFGTLLGGHCKLRWWGMLRAELGGTARARGDTVGAWGTGWGAAGRGTAEDGVEDAATGHGWGQGQHPWDSWALPPSVCVCCVPLPPLPHPPRARPS